MKKIVHLTSVHKRYDTRIFLKQCVTLADAGYDVYLVVADGLGDELKGGVNILDIGCHHTGRVGRITKTTKLVYNKALALQADLYHFHDPELIPSGVKLKKNTNAFVVFDSHENVTQQILSKDYLNQGLRVLASKLYGFYEIWACQKLNAIVTPTDAINIKFTNNGCNAVSIKNYPRIEEFIENKENNINKVKRVCYIGGLEKERGVCEMLDALSLVGSDIEISLAGNFSSAEFANEVKTHHYWPMVKYLGWLDRKEISTLLAESIAGVVVLHPLVNYIDSLPIKMFEYMAAGIPVVASNFPLWKEIVEVNNCGICVDPTSPIEIAKAIMYLNDNKDKAEEMGRNGRKAVLEKYNWSIEAEKLLNFYSSLLGDIQ